MRQLGSDLGTDTFRIYLQDGDAVHPQQPVPLSQLEDAIASVEGGSGGYTHRNYDDAGAYVYVGYENVSGAWYIYRRTVASGARLYATGGSGYGTNWTGRTGLTYA